MSAPAASTVVSAVLETAGYVTHAEVLKLFETFWQSGGALFFTCAAIGAVVSIVVFGSYPWGRYLIIAPGIFWFLISSTSDVDPVVWKLGGGNEQSINQVYRGDLDRFKNEDVKVSWFFYFVTKNVSGIVNSFVDLILQNENDKDLLFGVRNEVLTRFLDSAPKDDQLYLMVFETMFGDCAKMMNVAVAKSNPKFSNLHKAELQALVNQGVDGYQEVLERIEDEEEVLRKKFLNYGQEKVIPGDATIRFVIDKIRANEPHPILGSYENVLESVNDSGPFNRNDGNLESKVVNSSLSCLHIWSITQHAIMDEAERFINLLESEHLQPPLENNEENRKMLCKELARKIHVDYTARIENSEGETIFADEDECDLTQTAAVYMLRKLVSEQGVGQSLNVVEKLQRMKLTGRIDEKVFLDNPDKTGEGDHEERVYKAENGEDVRYRFNDKFGQLEVYDQKKDKWRMYQTVHADGHFDAAFHKQQTFATRGLIQSIYSYAMHVPYWQGVLLYLVSISYPFMALLVLVPGRALSFLYFPMLWLWLKSWDIGFAAVSVLDSILWELLPNTELKYKVFSEGTLTQEGVTVLSEDGGGIPEVLRASFAVDPTFNLHAHYNFISMALFLVPSLSGYAILKTKRSILASFTDGPRIFTDDADDVATGKYTMYESNLQHQKLTINAMGAQASVDAQGQGWTGGGRWQRAATWAAARGGATAYGQVLDYFGGRGDKKTVLSTKDYLDREEELNKKIGKARWKIKKAAERGARDELSERMLEELTDERRDFRRRHESELSAQKGRVDDAWKMAQRFKQVGADTARTYAEVLNLEQSLDAQEVMSYDPYLSSTGLLAHQIRGVLSGVDGGGGHELDHAWFSHRLAEVKNQVFTKKFWMAVDMGEDVLGDTIEFVDKHGEKLGPIGDIMKNTLGNDTVNAFIGLVVGSNAVNEIRAKGYQFNSVHSILDMAQNDRMYLEPFLQEDYYTEYRERGMQGFIDYKKDKYLGEGN